MQRGRRWHAFDGDEDMRHTGDWAPGELRGRADARLVRGAFAERGEQPAVAACRCAGVMASLAIPGRWAGGGQPRLAPECSGWQSMRAPLLASHGSLWRVGSPWAGAGAHGSTLNQTHIRVPALKGLSTSMPMRTSPDEMSSPLACHTRALSLPTPPLPTIRHPTASLAVAWGQSSSPSTTRYDSYGVAARRNNLRLEVHRLSRVHRTSEPRVLGL